MFRGLKPTAPSALMEQEEQQKQQEQQKQEGAAAFRPLNLALSTKGLSPGLLFESHLGAGSICACGLAEDHGNSSGDRHKPFRTGFASMYVHMDENAAASTTRVALYPRSQPSSLLFSRNEKPPLMNCTAFSNDTSAAGVRSR